MVDSSVDVSVVTAENLSVFTAIIIEKDLYKKINSILSLQVVS